MTKSKNSIVTTSTTYLGIVAFPVIVIESMFSLLPLGRYLLPITTLNIYLSSNSSKKFSFTTASENITITRHRVFLVTIPSLCFVIIHSRFSQTHNIGQLCIPIYFLITSLCESYDVSKYGSRCH